MQELSALLAEGFSKEHKDKIVRYVGSDRKRFDDLMKLFLSDDYRTTQRAAWPISYCAQQHPELLKPHFERLVNKLEASGQHDAVTRNITRMFQFVDIPEPLHGRVMNKCFDLIADHHVAVAIKAFSLTILENLSKSYPEILPELKLLIEERGPHESAAFSSRAKKILKRMSVKK